MILTTRIVKIKWLTRLALRKPVRLRHKSIQVEGHEHYLKPAAEMREQFGVPEACDNTLWIAERSDVEITFGEALLPNFPLPEGFDDDRVYLEHLTWEGKAALGAVCQTTLSSGCRTNSKSLHRWGSRRISS